MVNESLTLKEANSFLETPVIVGGLRLNPKTTDGRAVEEMLGEREHYGLTAIDVLKKLADIRLPSPE